MSRTNLSKLSLPLTLTLTLMTLMSAFNSGAQSFFSDFNSGTPAGMTLFQAAPADPPRNGGIIEGGYLKLTKNVNGTVAGAILDDFGGGAVVRQFHATFSAHLFGSLCCGTPAGTLPADGFSFNLVPSSVPNPPNFSGGAAEEGIDTGLAVNFDTWDNGGGEAPAIEVKWLGVVVRRVNIQPSQSPVGAATPEAAAKEVCINLTPDGKINVLYGGVVILDHVQTPFDGNVIGAGPKWVLGARTGGANDNHWIDNLRIVTGIPSQLVLTPTNTVWAYNDTTVSPGLHGTGWELVGYDTNSVPGWKSGLPLFGNDGAGIYDAAGQPFSGGINGFFTPLDRTGGRVTFYLRTTFTWNGPPLGVTLVSSNWVDDSLTAYLNGTETARLRLPAGPLTWDTLGSNPGTEGAVDVLNWDSSALVQGDNTVAVEVHQSSTGSSDVAFSVALEAFAAIAPIITDCTQPTNRFVVLNRNTTLAAFAMGSPSPTYQWFKDGSEVPGATSSTLVIGPAQGSDQGNYFCRVSNASGPSVDTRTAFVEVLVDGDPPTLVAASGSATFDRVTVVFNELLDSTTSADSFNYTIMDTGGNPLGVTGASLNPGGSSVTLTTDPQAQDTAYVVTVNNVQDRAGNVIVANSTIMFRSWASGPCNGVVFETFNVNNRLGIDDLLANQVNFPNNPRERSLISGFDSRLAYADDSHEDYAGRMRGLFIPPVSGNWIFHLRSDDPGRLFINPNGSSAAGKIRVANEAGCCAAFLGLGAAQTSPAFPMVAGQAYYIECLWREFGGGDYAQVAASLQGTATPTDPSSMVGGNVGAGAAPAGIAGPVTITSQPADVTVFANALVSFSANASNPTEILCFQWQRSDDSGATFNDIAGATLRTHQFGPVSLADNGALFRCNVGTIGATAVTRDALLNVLQDTNAPACVSASAAFNLSNVVVRFSEFVDPTTAADGFNYSVAGFAVNGAVLNADGMSVTLQLDAPMTPDTTYSVTIQNVTDLAGNTINPNPCTLNFRTPIISCGFALQENYFGIGGVAIADLRNAPIFPNSPSLTRYRGTAQINTFDEFDNYGARLSGWLIPPVSGNYNFFMSSDDGGEFWLSTDASPANIQLLAFEPVWNGRNDWTGTARRNAAAPENRSTTLFPGGIPLTAGQMYFFEALMKEGGGGDNLAVAWQIPGDPVPLNGSPAISGAYIGSLADPTGVSIVMTEQPQDQTFLIIPPSGAGSPILLNEDFNSGDGGFTVANIGMPFEGPFTYDGATGKWKSNGQGPELQRPSSTRLTSPTLTVGRSGVLRLTFNHRYSFEPDFWDGSQIRISVNGGAFTTVPAAAFTQNGYNGALRANTAAELVGQPGFVLTSAGHGAGTLLTSVANLGTFSAGDTIAVQFVAANDTNTRAGEPQWEIDDVRLEQGLPAQTTVTFRSTVVATAPGQETPPVFCQWYRNNVPIPGANSPTLTVAPTLSDNGAVYRVQCYTPGGQVNSRDALLTVVQPNTAPTFTCGPNIDGAEDSGPVTRPNWATDISAHSITRAVVAYANDFNSGPLGMQLAGIAVVADGALKLTTPINSSYGAASIAAPVQNFESLEVIWKSRVGGGASGGADGYSLNIGADVPADPGYGGEEGIGTGLIVTVDTFDNGTGLDVGVDIKWGGTRVAYIPIPKDDDGTGNFLRKDTFVDASVTLSPAGVATVFYDGNTTNVTIPGYAGLTASRALFWARTGGANDNQWVDDFSLQAFPFDASSAESSQTVKFLVSTDRPELFSEQPAISANGTLSYTPAPNACGLATLTVIAMDDGGTAFGGRDMSAPCTITLNVGCVCDPPVAVADTGTGNEGSPIMVNVLANDTDLDGDALTISAVTQGAHGTVAIVGGQVVYTPAPGFCGMDRFTYTITDGRCGSSTADVTINVICLNRCPVTNPLSVMVDQDGQVSFPLPASDPDGDPLTYNVTAAPAHGTVAVQAGMATYTPTPGYCGPDSFKYSVSDGRCTQLIEATVTIDVKCLNQCPTAKAIAAPDCVLATIQPPLIVSLDGSNACIVLDGSMSMDLDGDPLTFAWYLDGDTVPFATGPVVTNCFPIGEHSVRLVVDDGRCSDDDTIRFNVDSACVGVEALIDKVNSSSLSRKEKRPLLAALKKACSEFERAIGKKKHKHDDKHAEHGVKKLEEFQKKLKKIERDDRALAALWRAEAQAIIDAVNCALDLDDILNPDTTSKPPTDSHSHP